MTRHMHYPLSRMSRAFCFCCPNYPLAHDETPALPVVQDESLLHGGPQVLYLLQVTLLRTHLRRLALKPTTGHSSDHVLQRGSEEKTGLWGIV